MTEPFTVTAEKKFEEQYKYWKNLWFTFIKKSGGILISLIISSVMLVLMIQAYLYAYEKIGFQKTILITIAVFTTIFVKMVPTMIQNTLKPEVTLNADRKN